MDKLRWPARLYVAAVSLTAVGLILLLNVVPVGLPSRVPPLMAWIFVGLMGAAWLFPLPLSLKRKLYLDTCVLTAAILLFHPAVAMLIAGAGTAIAHVIRREDWVQGTFNSAQIMLQAAAGGLILASGTGGAARPLFEDSMQVVLVVVASGVIFLVDNLAVSTIVGLESGYSLPQFWYRTIFSADRSQFLGQLAQVGLGVTGAVLIEEASWTLPLLILPAIGIYSLLDRNIQLRGQAEIARKASDHNLADAQRIAHVGSWEWDLLTDKVVWSDEAYRIAGLVPNSFVPTHQPFLFAVHPEDQGVVEQAVGNAVHDGGAFSVEHRLRRPDGTERTVHQQGEVVLDDRGRTIRIVGTIQDITERKVLEAKLVQQAFHDALTLLPNRAAFLNRLGHALDEASKGGGKVAVLFLDLDRFKLINDSIGHEAGDQALVAIAQRLLASVRAGDTVARFGGDEFMILLDRADRDTALEVAERIFAVLRRPFCLTGHETFIGASIGIATSADNLSRASDVLRAADTALYRAKLQNRKAAVVFQPEMHAQAVARLELETALQAAVERGELQLYYQPEVELSTGRIVGVEALVRWERPGHGLVVPDEFIPIAEETGLIVPIGQWVLAEACRQIQAERLHRSSKAPVVSVNLSARQLQQPDLVDHVKRTLRRTGLPAHLLKLEVTERVLIEDLDASGHILQSLKALGVRLAIDDFGAGYSSLGYLRRLAVDSLKIDRSFIEDMGHSKADGAIVEAISSLAHAIGMNVTAEGIETSEQLSRVLTAGCDQAQGYYFAEPLPLDKLDHLLTSRIPYDLIQNAMLGTSAELEVTPVPQ